MTSNLCFSIFYALSIFILLPFFSSWSLAQEDVSPSTICKSCPDPSFCKKVLPRNKKASVYEYGRYSARKSLVRSRNFLSTVNNYLNSPSDLSTETIRALEDCQLLAELNMDFLKSSYQTENTINKTLPTTKADDIQTLLSAILTNEQTCLDALSIIPSASSVSDGLTSNNTKFYSVSLALFTKGWVPREHHGSNNSHWRRKHLPFRKGKKIHFKMSSHNQQIYNSVNSRSLLQTGDADADADDDEVLVSQVVTVSQDGSGNFTTISDAVAAAPNSTNGSKGYFMIYVTAGVYEEYVSIAKNKRYLMIVGDGINQTIITGNRSVVDGWTTFNSATLAVGAPHFVAMNMTIRNTAGAIKHQAVAVRNGGDLSTFYSCSFEAYQDTLYTHSLRQYYSECDIYGTVDFIFGNAAVVLQNCNIYPRLPMSGQFNAITAQGRTDPNQNTGTSIHNCTIIPADDLASSDGKTKTYLGRPWKEYSRTVFMQSFMDGFIEPAGWREWNGDFALSTLYYAEFDNTGPGADNSKRVTWPGYSVMNASDADLFTLSSFILGDDWLPQTGVPFTSGLLDGSSVP